MPNYDYECDACGHEWEMFQRMVEDAIKAMSKMQKEEGAAVSSAPARRSCSRDQDSTKPITAATRTRKPPRRIKRAGSRRRNSDSKSDSKSESRSQTAKSESKPAAKKSDNKSLQRIKEFEMPYNELDAEETRVIINKGTERPGTGELNDCKDGRAPTFAASCNAPLYESSSKFAFRLRLAQFRRSNRRRRQTSS